MGCDKGKCGTCACDNQQEESKAKNPITNFHSRHRDEVDIKYYLEPKRKFGPQPDSTPLEHKCEHWEMSSTMYRYQCFTCIRSWVWAVGIEEARDKIKDLPTVASERVERAIEEFKYEFELPKNQ